MTEPSAYQNNTISTIDRLYQIAEAIGEIYGNVDSCILSMEWVIDRPAYIHMDTLGISASRVRDELIAQHIDGWTDKDKYHNIILAHAENVLAKLR